MTHSDLILQGGMFAQLKCHFLYCTWILKAYLVVLVLTPAIKRRSRDFPGAAGKLTRSERIKHEKNKNKKRVEVFASFL